MTTKNPDNKPLFSLVQQYIKIKKKLNYDNG